MTHKPPSEYYDDSGHGGDFARALAAEGARQWAEIMANYDRQCAENKLLTQLTDEATPHDE